MKLDDEEDDEEDHADEPHCFFLCVARQPTACVISQQLNAFQGFKHLCV